MTTSIGGTTGITFPDASTQNTAATGFGFKNRIINGAMMIDQRNAGASVTPTGGSYTLDRWQVVASVASKFSVQQNAGSVTPPVGFTNYLGVTSLSAYSVGASEAFTIGQKIEGLNCSDLGWGTANAQTVTVSFWVRSSLTGAFGGCLQNSASDRYYSFSFTISAANTWEYKTVTIAGDTTGTWLTTSGTGIRIMFNLGSGSSYTGSAGSWGSSTNYAPTGSTSVVGTNGATFYITGVQLEKGSTATSFDYRPYGTELALCQRYYAASPGLEYYLYGAPGATYGCQFRVSWPVTMRAAPTYTKTVSTTAYASVANVVVTEAYAWDRVTASTNTNAYYYFSWTAAAEL